MTDAKRFDCFFSFFFFIRARAQRGIGHIRRTDETRGCTIPTTHGRRRRPPPPEQLPSPQPPQSLPPPPLIPSLITPWFSHDITAAAITPVRPSDERFVSLPPSLPHCRLLHLLNRVFSSSSTVLFPSPSPPSSSRPAADGCPPPHGPGQIVIV